MFYSVAAAVVLLVHFGFILFVLFGSALAVRYRWVVAIHVPAAIWGFLIEWTGGGCPLTGAENFFLIKAGQGGYTVSFVEHYLLPVIYPSGLTRDVQIVLAVTVVVINLLMYGWLLLYRAEGRRKPG
jgi:hypothetical protein